MAKKTAIMVESRCIAVCEFVPNPHASLFASCKDSSGRQLTVEDVVSVDDAFNDENQPYFEQGEHDHFIAWLSGRVAMKELR